jgi:hypothetical protein
MPLAIVLRTLGNSSSVCGGPTGTYASGRARSATAFSTRDIAAS